MLFSLSPHLRLIAAATRLITASLTIRRLLHVRPRGTPFETVTIVLFGFTICAVLTDLEKQSRVVARTVSRSGAKGTQSRRDLGEALRRGL